MSVSRKKVKIADVEPLIAKNRGNIAAVARALGVSRVTVHKRIRESAGLQEALSEARETMLDNAETALYSAALNGNMTALIFFLKTQGKSRGYTERQELTGADGQPMQVQVYIPSNGRD